MGEKTAGVGHFQIPTAPAALTAVAQSASANTLGSAVSFGNAPSTMFITGVTIGAATTQTPTYVQIQILVAASIVGSVLVPYGVSSAAASSVATGYRAIYPPIPVASGAAITVKSASSVASAVNWGVSLECIAQANVVDDGVAVATVTTVTNQLTGAQIATAVWQDATAGDFTAASSIGKSLYTSGNAPGAASGLQICGSNAATTYATLTSTGAFTVSGVSAVSQTGDAFAIVKAGGTGDNAAIKAKTDNLPAAPASTTNITAGTITTVTNLTNAPTAGDFTAAMKTSLNAATPASVTGAVGSVTAAVTLPSIPAGWITAAGIAASALDNKGNWNVGKTGYSLTQSFPANFASMALTASGVMSADVKAVNGITVNGSGTAGSPWGP